MERLAPVLASADFTFEFKEPANLPNPMLVMENTYFGYPPPEDAPHGTPATVIVNNVNKSVMAGQRIGILSYLLIKFPSTQRANPRGELATRIRGG